MTSKRLVAFLMIFLLKCSKNIRENSIPANQEHPNPMKIKETLTVQFLKNLRKCYPLEAKNTPKDKV